jgi:hypothetical protein
MKARWIADCVDTHRGRLGIDPWFESVVRKRRINKRRHDIEAIGNDESLSIDGLKNAVKLYYDLLVELAT